jgi:hypothetical protein
MFAIFCVYYNFVRMKFQTAHYPTFTPPRPAALQAMIDDAVGHERAAALARGRCDTGVLAFG